MANLKVVRVLQGDTRVSTQPEEVMSTILGSCVATCIWDPVAGVGGLNHFLLPGDKNNQSKSLSYGVNAMELLINGLLKHGADRSRLQVKLFGGAQMLENATDIGEKNTRFARWYAENENLPIVSQCLGGQQGRKIRFWPVTGRVQRCFIAGKQPEEPVLRSTQKLDASGEVDLF